MTGVPKEVEDDGQYVTREDLVKDGAGALVDNYIRENCYFLPWKDTKGGKGGATKPKKKDKRRVTEEIDDPGDKLRKGRQLNDEQGVST